MFVVVAYDMADDRRRLNLVKRLKDYGFRVQYSVFECDLDENLIKKLLSELPALLVEDDSLRFYFVCASCRKQVRVFGGNGLTADPPVYII